MQKQRNSTMEFLVWNLLTCFRLQISLMADQSHLPKSVIVLDFPKPDDVTMIKLIRSLSSWGKLKYHPTKKQTKTKIRKNKQTKQNRKSYLLPYAFMEDAIRHNIAQVTSTSKAYTPRHFVIIKWCHIIIWDWRQHRYGGR